MAITRKSLYAIRALIAMAREPARLHSVAEIAHAEAIPRAYLSAILNELVRHGIISSRRGPSGGYALSINVEEVSVARVIHDLEGPIFLVRCVSDESAPCRECTAACPVRPALRAANQAAWSALEAIRLADLVRHSAALPALSTLEKAGSRVATTLGEPRANRARRSP